MSNNEHLAYIFERAKKVTEALYRVTDLLSDKEPLKWEIREKAVFVFNNLISTKNRHFLERVSCLTEAENGIDELLVLLSLLSCGRDISGINFLVLKDEYSAVGKLISKEKDSDNFSEVFFGNQQELIGQPNGQSNGQTNLNGQSNIQTDISKINGDIPLKNQQQPEQKKKREVVSKNNNNDVFSPENMGVKNRERKSKILNIVKNKGRITVGELAVVFKEYSEKTIQRDLLEMVGNGVLDKEGDKRWRSYIFKGGNRS